MRKLLLGTAISLAIVTGASAADLYVKAPPPGWTGCYLAGGGGYGMWTQDQFIETDPGHGRTDPTTSTNGGRGWFGTAQGGCDYQLGSSWVIGAFADGDWGSLKGTAHVSGGAVGDETNSSTWAAGGRAGYLVM